MEEKTQNLVVVFADICNSTSYFRQHGDVEGRRIVMSCLERVTQTVVGLGGRIIDRIGDELLCVNPELSAGLQTGPAIQDAVTHAADDGGLPAGMKMRIGLHFGPVVVDGERIFGDTIHTAKRLVDQAK